MTDWQVRAPEIKKQLFNDKEIDKGTRQPTEQEEILGSGTFNRRLVSTICQEFYKLNIKNINGILKIGVWGTK